MTENIRSFSLVVVFKRVFCVSVRFAFQTLFGNDVICLTGLIELTRSVLGEETVDASKALLREETIPR